MTMSLDLLQKKQVQLNCEHQLKKMTHQWMKNILYWSEELKKLHGELSDASEEAETNPSHENYNNTLHQNQNIQTEYWKGWWEYLETC